jgi:uncharacterized membrane-anchored protein
MLSKLRRTAKVSTLYPCLTLNLFVMVLFSLPLFAADNSKTGLPAGIEWHKGPYRAHLGSIAEITIPNGYAFTDNAGTRRFMELTHNPSSENELGLIIPIAQAGDSSNLWFLLFDFDEIGYVMDSEKSSLDADKILASLQKNAERSNELRKEKGWAPFHLSGWQKAPFYDERSHNLTWATLGNSDDPKDGQTVNYSTRILGRRGAMSVDLVLDPTQLNQVLPAYQQLLDGFIFTPGSQYSEFIKGDKVASYGLTALIAGGAAAAAVKTGLFTKLIAGLAALWKVIAVGLVALAGAVKRFFLKLKRSLFGKDSDALAYSEQKPASSGIVSTDHDDSN